VVALQEGYLAPLWRASAAAPHSDKRPFGSALFIFLPSAAQNRFFLYCLCVLHEKGVLDETISLFCAADGRTIQNFQGALTG
jgi:hypothetical protein